MSLHLLPPFFGFLIFLGLALLTFFKGKGKRVNLLFAFLCLLAAFLNLDITLISSLENKELALKISRYDHLVLVYIIPLYLHFVLAFLSLKRRGLLLAAYSFSFFLMFFTQSDLYLADMYHYPFGFFAKAGPLLHLFSLATFITQVYCLWLLYKRMGEEKEAIWRNKVKYLLLGMGVTTILFLFNLFPLNGIEIYPPSNFSFIPMSFLAFALLRHDLLDLGILARRSLLYSFLTALLTGFYALTIATFGKISKEFELSDSLFFLLFFLIIVFVFTPLKERVQAFIDKVFFKDRYDYQEALKEVTQTITSFLSLKVIMNRLIDTIIHTMHLTSGAVFLWEEAIQEYLLYGAKGEKKKEIEKIKLEKDHPLIELLSREKRPLLFHHLRENPQYNRYEEPFKRFQAALIIPMVFQDSLKGLLILGNKKSGDLYSEEDLGLLGSLAGQAAVSIENAKAYTTIEKLNLNLEERVKVRTRELEKALWEKERTQEQLVRSESLASLGQLASGIAHELNNPLASVSSLVQSTVEYLGKIKGKRGYEEEVIDDLKFSLKELGRAKEIVRSLLDISRQTSQYTEKIDLNQVVKDALRVLYNQYKKGEVKIIELYEQELPEIQGNFAHLGQVCVNIIKNALQSLEGREGEIRVKTSYDPQRERVIFECQDNGLGIPSSLIKDIFKPFFTTKGPGKGTGLGLYICHEIVKRHGGEISVKSRPGEGTEVKVELPRG